MLTQIKLSMRIPNKLHNNETDMWCSLLKRIPTTRDGWIVAYQTKLKWRKSSQTTADLACNLQEATEDREEYDTFVKLKHEAVLTCPISLFPALMVWWRMIFILYSPSSLFCIEGHQPPHSPFFNICEGAFSTKKSSLKRSMTEVREQPHQQRLETLAQLVFTDAVTNELAQTCTIVFSAYNQCVLIFLHVDMTIILYWIKKNSRTFEWFVFHGHTLWLGFTYDALYDKRLVSCLWSEEEHNWKSA